MATVLPNGQQYYHNQPFYHPMSPQPGNPPMQQAADQRYAALRLQQAVKAGVIDASVLNAHPNTYPALWRMVSEKISAPANAAGYKDPGYWLRMGGPHEEGDKSYVDTALQSADHPQEPAASADASQMPGNNQGVIDQFIAMLKGGQGGMPGGIDPAMMQRLYAMFQGSGQSQNPNSPNLPQY